MKRTLVFSLLLTAATVLADNPETLTERSQARARAVLDAAVTAIGGADALQAIDTLRLELQGTTWPRLQMPTPAAPFEDGTFQETLAFDLKNNRIRLHQRANGAGFEGDNVVVLKNGEGTNYDFRAKTITPIPAAQTTQQQFVQYYRRLPNLLLLQALNRTNTLRYLGDEPFDGRKHDVITFVMPDTQQVALYIDSKTSLVSKYELSIVDPLEGDDASEILFTDYTTSGNLKVPQTFTQRVAGHVSARYRLKAEFNPPLADSTFEVAEAAAFPKVAAVPQNLPANVEKLAEGVYVIENVAGQNQNTLAIAFRDYIVAVEAPGSSAGADAVIKQIKETIPNKPIRYVAMTHHHGDHIGGLRSFIAEGATVVTTPGNRGVVEAMAAAPQNDRLAKSPRKPEVLLLKNGRHLLTDGERTVELIDVGPNPHAKEMVVAYLPKEKIVFQGDLFFLPNNDAPFGPPQATTVSFAHALKEKGLAVETIASVHGRTATIADLEKAMGTTATQMGGAN